MSEIFEIEISMYLHVLTPSHFSGSLSVSAMSKTLKLNIAEIKIFAFLT